MLQTIPRMYLPVAYIKGLWILTTFQVAVRLECNENKLYRALISSLYQPYTKEKHLRV